MSVNVIEHIQSLRANPWLVTALKFRAIKQENIAKNRQAKQITSILITIVCISYYIHRFPLQESENFKGLRAKLNQGTSLLYKLISPVSI